MADFKRFTGFIAPDGTTHETLAKVKEHVLKLKVRDAATKFALTQFATREAVMTPDEGWQGVIGTAEHLADFLIEHQAAIQAVFNQSVRERAVPKKKAVAGNSALPS
jgi:hypothetical protein